ncbi:MAG TPA: ParA family protein [Dehalococcoidia bacterium]
MTRILALANQKGGVGKTTTAINLGACLAERGARVLLVDIDAQGNATSGLGLDGTAHAGVYQMLVEDVPARECIIPTHQPGLEIIPASSDLAGAEVELVPMMAREYRLKRALEPLDGAYDFILLDCPPSLGLLTLNALAAATEVLIPVQCEYLALEGLSHLAQTLDLVRRNLNHGLRIGGLLLTMYDSRTNLSQQVADEVRKHFPETFQTAIPRSVRLSEAPSHGVSILAYDPSSRGAEAYRALADEVLARDPESSVRG